MDLTQYINLDHHIYISEGYLDTLLGQGEIYLKRSQYSNEMESIERDFGYIAKYRIAFNKREQKSDASIHVHIAKIDVKKKKDGVMTKTLAYFIHSLLEAYPDDKIEVSLHQSASEVAYKDKPIYQKLLTQVFISGELPYIYEVFTVDNREQNLTYYKNLMAQSDYQIRVVNKDDYKHLPIDRMAQKQEAVHYLKQMIGLDLSINNRNLSILEVQKLKRKYATVKKTKKRSRYIIQKVEASNNNERLLILDNQYISQLYRYDNIVEGLSDKDINEIFLVLKNDIQYMTDVTEFINSQNEIKEFIY
ncbi:TPA: hypothetical protein PC496_000747 [Clostridioides difficile]|nr:hypothetical protein [Clostridioides difficile]HDF2935083.1 hypothetical protein [Clostridioides difficile]